MADGTTASRKRARKARAPTTPDPVEIAMEAEAAGVAPAGEAALLLRDQRRLIRWQIASERAGFTLRVLTALAGLAIAGVLAAMAWRASEAGGLVVEAFVVPPVMAEDGMTGEVVARGVLDNLAKLDRETNSIFQTKVSDSWSNSTKISLAQTGVSVDDLDRLLRRWLGDETYVQGELVRTPAGVRLTARASAGAEASVEGPADQIPALTAQLAEELYKNARPNGYAELMLRRRNLQDASKAVPVLREVLATSSDAHERTLAHLLLGTIIGSTPDRESARADLKAAMSSPQPAVAIIAGINLASLYTNIGRSEAALQPRARADDILRKTGPRMDEVRRAAFTAQALAAKRDYLAAEREQRPLIDRRIAGQDFNQGRANYANVLALLHQLSAADRLSPGQGIPVLIVNDAWERILQRYESVPALHSQPLAEALRAIALTKLGRLDEASTVLAATPADCDICHAAKGVMLAARGDVPGSEAAFAEAVRLAPSNPQMLVLRGRERLARGDAPGALADFEAAHKLAPKWADPLAFWSEALLAQGRSDAASIRSAEAEKLAPRWGRLHLKWGEALAKLGKTDEARAKWRAAAGMDLTAEERAELAKVSGKPTP